MSLAQVFPLAARPVPVPPSPNGILVAIPSPLAGTFTLSPAGPSLPTSCYVLPPGTAGLVRMPIGGTGLVTQAVLSNPGDAAGAFVIAAPDAGQATDWPPKDAPTWWDQSVPWYWAAWRYVGGLNTYSRFLTSRSGNLSELAGPATLWIRQPLVGSLTIAGQTVPAGTAGRVALTNPITQASAWAFNAPDDYSSLNDVIVIGGRA